MLIIRKILGVLFTWAIVALYVVLDFWLSTTLPNFPKFDFLRWP